MTPLARIRRRDLSCAPELGAARRGSPTQRRASGHTPPSIRRLRTIALALVGGVIHDAALGLTLDDLVAAGWLGYVEAAPSAVHLSYPYQRARWAMLDELRRWYGARARTWCTFDPERHGGRCEPVDRASYDVAAAAIDRHTEPAHARVLRLVILDDLDVGAAAQQLGLSRRTVANYKAQGLRALRRALAA